MQEGPGDSVLSVAERDANDIHPWRQDVVYLEVIEVDHAVDQLAVLFIDGAVLLGFLHNGEQLLFRHAGFVFGMERLFQQLFPQ